MLPVISIVGRPNVGKSTLFNRLTRSRDALVNDVSGVTRDRLYGIASCCDRQFLIVDTGGIGEDDGELNYLIAGQVESVLEESDAIIFLVDAADGLTVTDEAIASKLTKFACPLWLAVNKAEGLAAEIVCAEFHAIGLSSPVAISAKRGSGVLQLLEPIIAQLPHSEDPLWLDPGPKIAVIGRPNVGKSTLINCIAAQKRLIVSAVPGTTRDSVTVPLEYKGKRYRFIDTAGVRRRSRVGEVLEKLSVVKTLQAIEAAHVAVLVLDGSEPIADQDATLAGLIRRAGRPVVIVINKSDQLSADGRNYVQQNLQRKLAFAAHHEALYTSGLRKQGIGQLLNAVEKAYGSAMIELPTAQLNRYLREAVTRMAPPMAGRRPVKLKYAHQGGRNPPVVVVHGNNVGSVAESYRRYLENYFRESFELFGTDVRVVFRSGANPFDKQQ